MRFAGASMALVAAFAAGCAFRPDGAIEEEADAGAEVDAVGDLTDPTCPSGYEPIAGSTTRYRIVETDVPWATAAADCNDDGDGAQTRSHTHLVVVGSAEEKAALRGQFSGNTWVGLTDEATEGDFVWVTVEPTGGFPVVGEEPPWDSGDPDGGSDENCVRFKNSYDFEDKPCGDPNSYVCECDRYALR